ncbi:MAG TPA: hypothetical protein VFC78_12865, partial [Tepidisphaeraceae bacterium]|nr:hypothetical protein [Tepidisphaeraceae bacterium]
PVRGGAGSGRGKTTGNLVNPGRLFPIASNFPVRYWNGAVVLNEVDLVTPRGGFFSHQRSYNNQTSAPYDGPNGWNWFVSQMPYVVVNTAGNAVAVVFDPNNPFWFDKSGTTYTPHFGMLDVTLVEDTAHHKLTFSQNGGGNTEVAVFNSLSAPTAPGGLISYTGSDGLTATVTSRSGNLITEIQRGYSGTTTVDSLLYTWFTSGTALGKLKYATYRRGTVSPIAWTNISQCQYAYCGASDVNGSVNDLMSATQQIWDGTTWEDVAPHHYRYFKLGDANGFVHGLKMHFGPEACRLIFNAGINIATALDSDIVKYADHQFQYDSARRVALEVSAVCPSCPGGGTTSDQFVYTASANADGFNSWAMKCVQTLPDGSTIIVYTNFAGLPMLYINVDPSKNASGTFYKYDETTVTPPATPTPLLVWIAMPSALALPSDLTLLDANADLLGYNSGTGLYAYMQASGGLIHTRAYGPDTGVPAGYLESESVLNGQATGATSVELRSYTYTSNTDSGGNVVNVVATDSVYPAGSAITTNISYTWHAGTNQIQQRTTTLPAVSSGQNGSGSADTFIEQFDAEGNTTQTTDERSVVNTYAVDPILGRVTEQVLNYQSGVTQVGVNVTTDFTWDNQGRLTLVLGPSHTVVIGGTATTIRPVTNQLYVQSIQPTPGTTWDVDQTWIASGYATGSPGSYAYTLVNPVIVSKIDKDGRSTDQIASKRAAGMAGLLVPPGISGDTFAQTNWQTWSTTQYSAMTDAGATPPTVAHQMISQRAYFLIPSSGIGTVGTNFAETDFGYDALERRNRVVAPGGTITRKVWNTPQRVASVWVGTNDAGATDSNPAGSGSPNNMVQITANQYDGGSAGGDGNLTQITKYVSATSGDTRLTAQGFDFRDRRTSITDALGGYIALTLDDLDRTTLIQQYASLGGYLIAQSGTNFDNRGQIYQQLVYAVDPTTGTVGNALTTNIWRDAGGNIVQQINAGDGKTFTKFAINGVGWITNTYRGYNTSGTSYSQAQIVTNDTIFEESDFTFDEAGNVISAVSSQRLNDATGTGALSAGTQPKARVSYTAGWFDGLDRAIANANYGAASSFTRPTTPPLSSATVLVNSMTYDDAGRENQTTDPLLIVNQMTYDNASRKTQTVDASGSSTPRTTNYTYTLDDQIATMTAVNATTGNQTTTWAYGTALATSGVARNDLLSSVTYPDSVSGSDVVAYTYNRLSEQFTITDQRGTVRMLYRDKLGRQTDDAVPTVGTGTDNAVLRISTTYEVRGMVKTITSYNNATPGSGTALNQVQLDYNTFAQLIKEWQEHSGTVTGSSLNVQYAFDTGASNSNEIRLNQLTYPNLRTITPDYGPSGGMNDLLNRVGGLKDGTTTLAAYTFIGLGAVIRRDSPEPRIRFDLWGGVSGVFNGLDLFSRIIDNRWLNYSTSTDLDRYQYGYDQNSNRLWKANLLTTGLDEFYLYDPLNRLTEMQRGVLNSTKTGITGTPPRQMSFGLDITGNWGSYLTKTSGTTDLSQTRTSNAVNEITAIGGTPGWVTPAYDPAGNMTTMPQPASPANSYTAVYDGLEQNGEDQRPRRHGRHLRL